MRLIAAILAASLAFTLAAADDPAHALADGRRLLATGDCHGAAQTLQNAVPAATALPAQKKEQALAAIHFYSARAFHDCGLEDQANVALREFFRFQPDAAELDPAKYDRAFIRRFEEVQRKAASHERTQFEHLYGGYDAYAISAPSQRSLVLWGANPEFQLLATPDERAQWDVLRDDDARTRFVDAFWKRRDRAPETNENEYRVEVLRRIAFADSAFRTSDYELGSLTDRGRVFVLLGPPKKVSRRPIMRTTIRRPVVTQIDGQMERWIYGIDQLPAGIPGRWVEFTFITQKGYGDNVMQKEWLPLKVLAAAQNLRK